MKTGVLLLTGWGATCKVWDPIIPALAERFQTSCVAPPWVCDNSLETSFCDFDQYVTALANSLTSCTNIVAWSLGGLVAIRLAYRYQTLVEKIVFISSTPKFVRRSNTEVGIESTWFEQFKNGFESQPEFALKKFLALQAKGDEFNKVTLQQLRNYCRFGEYQVDECNYALNLLGQLDLSGELKQLQCSADFVHGECDAVLPLSAGYYAASLVGSDLYTVKAAGHAPHISHPQSVTDIVLHCFT